VHSIGLTTKSKLLQLLHIKIRKNAVVSMTSIPDCSDDFAKYATAQKPKEYLFQTCQDWFSYKQNTYMTTHLTRSHKAVNRDSYVFLFPHVVVSVITLSTRKLSCGWETRTTRQHSKFIQKKSIEIRNEHSERLLRLHTVSFVFKLQVRTVVNTI